MPKPGRYPSFNGDEDQDDERIRISFSPEEYVELEAVARALHFSVPRLIATALAEYVSRLN